MVQLTLYCRCRTGAACPAWYWTLAAMPPGRTQTHAATHLSAQHLQRQTPTLSQLVSHSSGSSMHSWHRQQGTGQSLRKDSLHGCQRCSGLALLLTGGGMPCTQTSQRPSRCAGFGLPMMAADARRWQYDWNAHAMCRMRTKGRGSIPFSTVIRWSKCGGAHEQTNPTGPEQNCQVWPGTVPHIWHGVHGACTCDRRAHPLKCMRLMRHPPSSGIFHDHFQVGGRAAAFGMSGDVVATLHWRLLHGELPRKQHPRHVVMLIGWAMCY